MAQVYAPESLNIKAPAGGFQQGGWYSGRQYWGGTLSEPGVIHPQSYQQGAGQAVSEEVNRQSAAQQGVSYPQFADYLQQQKQTSQGVAPTASYTPAAPGGFADASLNTPSGAGLGMTTQPSVNLLELYASLTQSSGIQDKQLQLTQMEKEFAEAKGRINDNPFLSEATRVGRVAKLEQLYQDRTAPIRGEIAQAQADIETQLNLQSKQFDINSQVAKQNLDQFNTLLSLGALDNATGEDIAALTRQTGISSAMIQSAIASNKAKNIETQTISFDDGENQGFAIVNSQTGEIINRQIVSQSKATSSGGSSGSSGGGLTTTQKRNVTSEARKAITAVDKNKDELLSKAEYTQAVRDIMTATGLDFNTADNYATSAFNDLGFKKWRW